MRKLTYILFLFFISCNSEKEITLNELYGTYEHVYTDWDNEEDIEWDGIKNIVTINKDSTYSHQLYIKDSLFVNESGIYEYNRFVPCFDLKNYTKYVKYVSVKPKIVENTRFIPKINIWGNIYLIINWGMDPDGAPAKPKYKKIK